MRGGAAELGWYAADLHVHTALSACADDRMSPGRIVRAAEDRGISILGITDHNSAENARAAIEASHGTGVRVLPGMEVQTREDVHVLCLFEELESALELQRYVYERLPEVPYAPRAFGRQVLYDGRDRELGECERPLYASISAGLSELANEVRRLGGLTVAAHADREAFGIGGVLGFIPPGVEFDAVEVSRLVRPGNVPPQVLDLVTGRCVVQSSDAHSLEEVGTAATAFRIARVSLDEMMLAMKGGESRKVVVLE